MKTQVLFLLFSIFTLSAFAGKPLMSSAKAKTITVETSLWKAESVTVQIKEIGGSVILDEVVKSEKGFRKYDLHNLPSGTYTLELSDDLKIKIQNFVIKGEDLSMSKEVVTIYKPVILVSENNIDVNLLTLNQNVSVKILDDNDSVVFSEKIVSPSIHKRYDLTRLSKGQYTMKVSFGGRSFYQHFTK